MVVVLLKFYQTLGGLYLLHRRMKMIPINYHPHFLTDLLDKVHKGGIQKNEWWKIKKTSLGKKAIYSSLSQDCQSGRRCLHPRQIPRSLYDLSSFSINVSHRRPLSLAVVVDHHRCVLFCNDLQVMTRMKYLPVLQEIWSYPYKENVTIYVMRHISFLWQSVHSWEPASGYELGTDTQIVWENMPNIHALSLITTLVPTLTIVVSKMVDLKFSTTLSDLCG